MRGALLTVAMLAIGACDDPFAPRDVRHYTVLTVGGAHACAIATTADAYCWGVGEDGRLGTERVEDRDRPGLVSGDLQWKDITAGEAHTCALTTDGEAYCWGWNSHFQLGAVVSEAKVPVRVNTALRFRSISAGAYHTCAMTDSGQVHCWGNNQWGQLGSGNTRVSDAPIRVAGTFTSVSSGSWHTCATASAGRVFCWGRNDQGQLGDGSDVLMSLSPVQALGAIDFAMVNAGESHTCGVAVNQRAFCWGSNEFGELGIGGTNSVGLSGSRRPVLLPSLLGVLRIDAGADVSCAMRTGPISGWCWGRGTEGQLGVGDTKTQFFPQPIYLQPGNLQGADRLRFTMLLTSGQTTCGLSDQSVYCWGDLLDRPGPVAGLLPTRVRQ